MKVKLPKPIILENDIIREIEIKRLKSGNIADVSKIIRSQGIYRGYEKFLTMGISGFYSQDEFLDDNSRITGLVRKIPVVSCEFLVIKILLLYDIDDGIMGIYKCPLCGSSIICDKPRTEDDVDTRDFISELEIVYDESDIPERTYYHILKDPVIIKDKKTGEEIKNIESITYHYPLLQDCINAELQYGITNEADFQFAVLANSTEQYNGSNLTDIERKQWAMYVQRNIENIKYDINGVSNKLNEFGMKTKIRRTCKNCNKEWFSTIDTSSFFVSGLDIV